MGPVARIFAALFLTSVFQMAPAPAAGGDGASPGLGPKRPMIRLVQGHTDQDRAREEEERRATRRRRERRATREGVERDRARRWSEERRLRLERSAREHLERQRKEREARSRGREEGLEAREGRRRRARRARRLDADRGALLKRFPAAWVVGIVEGRVEKGWSGDAVRASWGKPRRILKVPPADELWLYRGKHVILSNGTVRDVVVDKPKGELGP